MNTWELSCGTAAEEDSVLLSDVVLGGGTALCCVDGGQPECPVGEGEPTVGTEHQVLVRDWRAGLVPEATWYGQPLIKGGIVDRVEPMQGSRK